MPWIVAHPAPLSLNLSVQFSSFQFSSVAQSCPTLCDPWIAARPASMSITNSWSSLRLTSIESVMPFSHLIFCHPLLLLPLIPPSIKVFSNESALCMRWPKYWSFSFSIIPSAEHRFLNIWIEVFLSWRSLILSPFSRSFCFLSGICIKHMLKVNYNFASPWCILCNFPDFTVYNSLSSGLVFFKFFLLSYYFHFLFL